jgi:uncharacterized protein
MLRIELAALRRGPVETAGEVSPEALALGEQDVSLTGPVAVQGRLSGAGEGRYYWRARLNAALRGECRRCLAPVDMAINEDVSLMFAQDGEGTEDEGFYVIPARERHLDLVPALREELLLALPHYALCRPGCKGLCARCGANLNEGPCGCAPAPDPRWDALRALSAGHPKTD